MIIVYLRSKVISILVSEKALQGTRNLFSPYSLGILVAYFCKKCQTIETNVISVSGSEFYLLYITGC